MMGPQTNAERPLRGIADWWHRYGVDEETTLTVYVRSYVPPPASHESRRRLLNTLSFAESRDRIRDHEFRVVGAKLCLCEDCRPTYNDSGLLETLGTVSAWTDGKLSSSGFQTQTVRNGTTGERYQALVPPETTVTVSRDDTLVGVFPCEVGGETYGLEQFLRDLREAATGGNPVDEESASEDSGRDEILAGESTAQDEALPVDSTLEPIE